MSLPKFKSEDQSFSLLQTAWATQLDPVINNPLNNGNFLKNIILSSSAIINHGLGRTLQGWEITRLRGNATVYDIQDTNTQPTKTLLLIASSGVSCDLFVF